MGASSGCAGQPHFVVFPIAWLLAVIRLVEHRLAEALPVPAWDDVEAHTSGHLRVHDDAHGVKQARSSLSLSFPLFPFSFSFLLLFRFLSFVIITPPARNLSPLATSQGRQTKEIDGNI